VAIRKRTIAIAVLVILLVLAGVALALTYGLFAPFAPAALAGGVQVDELELPPGFRIAIYAEAENARSLARGPDGIVFVGTRDAGKVYALVDRDRDHRADTITIATGLHMPNGVAFRDGDLYVAEVSRVTRYAGIADRLDDPPEPTVVRSDLPTETHHGWKFIRFGPDGRLYVPVGAPCNVCESADDRFAAILRMNADGSGLEVFARGVRNTVGFDWDPATQSLWFTDNGRDWLGDDAPADELDHAPTAGLHFGFPHCHGRATPDPDLARGACTDYVAPALELPAHSAALGMRFYDGDRFPERYRGGIFVAHHGSWNRSTPVGYEVTFVPVVDGRAGAFETFASGWLRGVGAWGRPVDVEILDDGSMLVSDDKAGLVYRISYDG
jgi:glucose/arabinose dehydrogenase